MIKICKFGNDDEWICQQEKDGKPIKLFNLVTAEGENLMEDLVPCLKNSEDKSLLFLKGMDIDEEGWFDKTGMTYIPKGFHQLSLAPDDLLVGFGLKDKTVEDVFEQEDTFIEQFSESSVEELSTESDKQRTSAEKGTSLDCYMDMVNKRGQKVYSLAKVESEMDRIKEDADKKLLELQTKKEMFLESIDTYDNCLRIFLKENLKGGE